MNKRRVELNKRFYEQELSDWKVYAHSEWRWIMDNEYPDSPSVQGAGAYDSFENQRIHETLQRSLGGKMIRERTKLERLKDAKVGLEAKLEEINIAIRLLEENPKIMEIIIALERAGV